MDILLSRKPAFLAFAIVWLAAVTPLMATPIITTQPLNKKDIQLGSEIELQVDARSSTGILTYQWQINGIDILDETNSVLRIDKADVRSSGSYTVVVDDGNDAITSIPVVITVAIPLATRNDMFANRFMLLQISNGTVRSENNDATIEPGEPLHDGKPGSHSVWFGGYVPLSGIVTLDTEGSGFDTILEVYEVGGPSITKLAKAMVGEQDDDGGGFLTSRLTFNATPDKQYAILVDGYGGQTGDIILNWAFEPTPDVLPLVQFNAGIKTVSPGSSLDLFVDWINGDACEWLLNGKGTGNKNKTYSLGKISAADVGNYSVTVKNSKRDSKTQPVEIQLNLKADGTSDPTSFAFNKLNDAYLDAQKKSSLRRISTPKISVKLFAAGPGLMLPLTSGGTSSGYSTTQIFNTQASTKEPGEPNHCGVAGGASEWYNFQPDFNGTVHITTEGSSYDTVLAVYTGPGDSFSSLVPLVCNNAKFPAADEVRFQGNSNTVYYIAIDGVGGARGTAKLNISLGNTPQVVNPPQSTNLLLNASTTLSVAATGTGPLFYQWQLAGNLIPNATNSTLTITNFQSSNAGNYTVIVSNKIDVVTSAGAMVLLATAPQIQNITGSQTIVPNASVNLLGTVSANPFADLQWYFNSTRLQSKTSINLLLTNFSAANEGIYLLVASNFVGSVTSAPVQLALALPLRLSSYGVSNSTLFALHSVGLANTNVVVLTSSNLVTWTPLVTNFSLSGFVDFNDPLTNCRVPRFYQFKVQP